MRYIRQSTTAYLCVLSCLILSGCFQGYEGRVTPTAGNDPLNSQRVTSIPQSTQPIVQVTGAPPLDATTTDITIPPTATNEPIVMADGTIIHIVAEGETLFEIAQAYGVTVEELTALNGLDDANSIFVAQALIIPNQQADPPTATTESTQTSNLPTPSPTLLPTLTFTLSPTITPIPTPLPTQTATELPTLTAPPPPSDTAIPPPTAVELVTVTSSPTTPVQLRATNRTTHIVETGETLFRIAQTYDVTLESLALYNNIEDTSQVIIGQELTIPDPFPVNDIAIAEIAPAPTQVNDGTTDPEATPQQATHIVRAGENLFQIALDYSVSLESLTDLNGISDSNQVIAGQELLIPDATVMPIVGGSSAVATTEAISGTSRTDRVIPAHVNGVPLESIFSLSPITRDTVLDIYQRGQEIGRNPRAFSKLGDSTIENPHFLTRFDDRTYGYNLGNYAYLQGVIDYFAGSYGRQGVAVRRGMHSWTVFDPAWADKSQCLPRESALECEFRLNNPSILLIRLGANDVGVPQSYEDSMREILDFSISNGVIPIFGTKGDRNDGAGDPNNRIIRRLAEEYQLPLWDYDAVAGTLPNRGLTNDGVHMSINFSHDYTAPSTFTTGHGVNNLTALIVLDTLWQTVDTLTTSTES